MKILNLALLTYFIDSCVLYFPLLLVCSLWVFLFFCFKLLVKLLFLIIIIILYLLFVFTNFIFINFLFNSYTLILVMCFWNFLLTIIGVLLSTALLTLLERKIMASVQRRKGPNVVGFFGLLQPFADGLKLALKETTVPSQAVKPLFVLGPILSFSLAIFGWALLPFPTLFYTKTTFSYFSCFCIKQVVAGSAILDFDVSLLFIFVIVALHVYGVLLGGWGSNSRYALLGALRATAQSISYELVMGFTILILAIYHKGFSLVVIVYDQSFVWNLVSLFPLFLVFYICSLAELNRTPFDLVEAEGELVAGYNVEYSAMMFALYFLGEYISIIFSSFVIVILFLGAWYLNALFFWLFLPVIFIFNNFFINLIFFFVSIFFFTLKITVVIVSSLLVRFVLPRYRYDQLMSIGWLIFFTFYFTFINFLQCMRTVYCLIKTVRIHTVSYNANNSLDIFIYRSVFYSYKIAMLLLIFILLFILLFILCKKFYAKNFT